VLVELDSELLVQWPSVEAGDLAVDLVHQRGGYAVINDRVKADLAQRVAQLGRGAVERPGRSREIGPKIDDRDGVSIDHGCWHSPVSRPELRL
jgi:hypothetical protein